MFVLCTTLIGLAGVSACGGSTSTSLASVLAPAATNTVTGLTLTLSTPGVGASIAAAGIATLSSGTTVTLSSGYSSSNPNVATASAAGVITGVAIGDATISVDYQSFHAEKKIHVLPNYNGIFVGNYTIDTCVDSLGFTDLGFCASFAGAGALPIAFSNAQSTDLTQLSGLFALGTLQGTSTGTVAADGTLSYAGTLVAGTTTMNFQDFVITSTAPGHIVGKFKAVFTDSASTGGATWTCTMTDTVRTSGGLRASAVPVTNAGGFGALVAALRAPAPISRR
jgi:hypothetical protein